MNKNYLSSSDYLGQDLAEVNEMFNHPNTVSVPCYICQREAVYKLIPKGTQPLTAEIERIGYVCADCINQGRVSNQQFSLKHLYK